MRFVALDVETANPRMSSICQIGLVGFEDGRETFAKSYLIDPRDDFSPFHTAIHGLTPEHVAGSPCFADLAADIHALTLDQAVVCHTHFDRVAMARAAFASTVPLMACRWIDSARVARRVWADVAERGYGLRNLADRLGISFEHHDALHDARTAGLILIAAVTDSGHDLDHWHAQMARQSINANNSRVSYDAGEDGPLTGEVCVFTGAMMVPRADAARIAHEAGAAVAPGVNKNTTMVIVGDQDLDRLAGKAKSAKHLKAESLIAAGYPIRILSEDDFLAILA